MRKRTNSSYWLPCGAIESPQQPGDAPGESSRPKLSNRAPLCHGRLETSSRRSRNLRKHDASRAHLFSWIQCGRPLLATQQQGRAHSPGANRTRPHHAPDLVPPARHASSGCDRCQPASIAKSRALAPLLDSAGLSLQSKIRASPDHSRLRRRIAQGFGFTGISTTDGNTARHRGDL